MVFVSGDREIPVKVAAIYKTEGQHVYGRTEFVLPKADLESLPVIWYGALHAAPKKVAGLQRAFFEKYPTVTVINMADVFDMVEGVVRQITVVVRFLAGFSMVAGMMILASSVASTRFRRIREVVVLKTLGATRKHVLSVFSIEFLVLGLLSGVVGVIFANLLARILLHRMEIGFQIEWLAGFLTLVGTAFLATATGWVASYRILGQKPLEVLREE
jgi:putative ABC transport system permease protein